MKESVTLTVIGIVDGYRVRSDDMDKVVNGIKIAGNEIIMGSGEFDIECTDYAIEGEYDPYLLVEPAEWFSPD